MRSVFQLHQDIHSKTPNIIITLHLWSVSMSFRQKFKRWHSLFSTSVFPNTEGQYQVFNQPRSFRWELNPACAAWSFTTSQNILSSGHYFTHPLATYPCIHSYTVCVTPGFFPSSGHPGSILKMVALQWCRVFITWEMPLDPSAQKAEESEASVFIALWTSSCTLSKHRVIFKYFSLWATQVGWVCATRSVKHTQLVWKLWHN